MNKHPEGGEGVETCKRCGGDWPERERAIADLRRMRQTHEEWLRHVTVGPDGKTERCPECAEGNVAEIVGDADHHKACIADYDNALAVLAKGTNHGDR